MRDDDEKATYVRILEETPVRALAGNAWTWIGSEKNKHLEGMAWEDAAELRGESIGEMVCNVMLEENMICGFRGVPPQSVRLWRQVEEDIMKLISRPDYMIGSDAIPVGGMVHPPGIRVLPQGLRQAAAQARLPARADNPTYDAKPGAAVRTQQARRNP